jgi:hypothetical protein
VLPQVETYPAFRDAKRALKSKNQYARIRTIMLGTLLLYISKKTAEYIND